jgi:SPP1 gp7 family putative phage head morphogenesis protein
MRFLGFELRRNPKNDMQRLHDLLTLGKGSNDPGLVEKAKSLIVTLQQNTQQLAKKDIASWRRAHQLAVNIDNPKRIELYNIYDFTTALDAHVEGVWLQIRSKLKQKKFRLVNIKTKEENPDLTELFESSWFKEFLEYVVETKMYGHSLLQFGDVISVDGKMRFRNIELVPRIHVCPERQVLLRDPNDDVKTGTDYSSGALARWSVEIGKPKDLGSFLKASPKAISKKYIEIFWDNFAERFGIPILYANTDSRNESDRKKVTNMLANIGNNAWGLFPVGTELKLIETTKGDAYMVFDQRIERCEQQISKCMAGQTMVFDDGASRAQGEVHLEGFNAIMESFADDARDVINDRLLPFMHTHGFPVAGHRFDWDDTYEFKPAEIQKEEEMLLQHYEIPPEYFTTRYNIPISGKRETPSFPNPNPDLKKKFNSSVTLQKPEYGDAPVVALKQSDNSALNAIATALIRRVWDDRALVFSFELFEKTAQLLFDNLARGILGKKEIKLSAGMEAVYEHRNQAAINMMEANIFRFSAAKTQAAVIELNQLARESKNFSEFNEAAKNILENYNGTYLRTEYSNAYQTGTMAARYWEMKELQAIYPTWVYKTMGDDHVRPEHAELDNMELAADDPAWKTIYPPNGWNCRCYVVPIPKEAPSHEQGEKAVDALSKSGVDKNGQSELDRMRKQGFAVNRAEAEVAFTESQMYIKEFGGKFNVPDMYGTKEMRWKNIDKTTLPERVVSIDSKEKAVAWFEKQKDANGRVLFADYAGRQIRMTAKTMTEHLDETVPRYKNRHELINLVSEILANPDEVWLDKDERLFMYRYIKMYRGEMAMVACDFKRGKTTRVYSWYDIQDDSNRKGILIKKKK